jgi:hypothetical protein
MFGVAALPVAVVVDWGRIAMMVKKVGDCGLQP